MALRKTFGIIPYREGDSRRQGCRPIQRNFLIVCEGKKTEPNYFNSIRRRMESGAGSKVVVVGAGAHTRGLIDCTKAAIAKRRTEGLPEYYHVWVVFDKDSFEADDFDNTVKMVESENWHAGWSNEAFELWYLLHFQEVNGGSMSREQMFELLSAHGGCQYMKNDDGVFDRIKGQSYVAIARARKLAERWDGMPPHLACPCTKVWTLVADLLKYT